MFKRKRIIFAAGLIIVVTALFVFAKSQESIPIIMYHSVVNDLGPGDRLQVSVKSFKEQMSFLKTHKYNVVSLEKVGEMIKNKTMIPANTIAITFDDGFIDNYINVYPILKEYKFPATIFIVTNEVGRPQGGRLSWDQIKQMQESGLVDFGAHTLDHVILEDLKDETELKRQISGSKKALEDKLGREIDLFCYPGGRFNPHIRQLVVDAGFKLAVTTNPTKKLTKNDLFALRRVRISPGDNFFIFWLKTSGYYNIFRNHNKR